MDDTVVHQYVAQAANVSDASIVSPKQQFQRTYQACLPCRKRKVKCDLGSPDDPHEPPCAKCKREHKECVFSETRRKRRASAVGSEDTEGDGETPSYLKRRENARHQNNSDDSYTAEILAQQLGVDGSTVSQATSNPYPQDDAHYGQSRPSNWDRQHDQSPTLQDQQVISGEAGHLFHDRAFAPTDTINMLIHAGVEIESQKQRESSSSGNDSQKVERNSHRISVNDIQDGYRTSSLRRGHQQRSPLPKNSFALDPAITVQNASVPEPSKEVLRVWSRLRFVRAGWFTAREAANFVTYYYAHLAPLTPITHPDLRKVDSNPDLPSQEPMLTVTILTISSRYMKVTGAGHDTRSLMIHEKLWQYLQNMVSRAFWGQEQAGGGFCGAGARKATPDPSDNCNMSRLRALGTVESLLLLSDFHPRSMHFPPSDDDGDLLAPAIEDLEALSLEETQTQPVAQSMFAGWTEPAARSDQMTWSLICFAHTLAYELGVFGTYAKGRSTDDTRIKHEGVQTPYEQRIERIDRLLYIYMTQACGRYGFPGMYPKHLTERYIKEMKAGFRTDIAFLNVARSEDVIQYFWIEVISLNKYCNNLLFQSRDMTGNLIENGGYTERLQDLVPRLHAWEARLQRLQVDRLTKTLLSIEIHYFLIYVKGIALQAVLENYTSKMRKKDDITDHESPISSTSSHISHVVGQNEDYTKGVIDACRKVLLHVVEDLLPHDHLRHAPVRAVFRIVSAAMFLLKTFALGATRSEMDKSIELLDSTIDALRTSVVDDVHLSLRIADVLAALIARIKDKLQVYKPEFTADPNGQQLAGTQASGIGQSGMQGIRFVRKPRAGSFTGPSVLGAPNSSINVMPPPRALYQDPTLWSYAMNNGMNSTSNYGQSQFSNMGSPLSNVTFPETGAEAHTAFSFPPEHDWMTIGLGGLIEDNGVNAGGDPTLFGNPFGPEPGNGMGVLQRLTSEPYSPTGHAQQQNGTGDGGMRY